MEKLSIKFNYLSSLSLQETCDIEEAVQNKGQTEPYVLLVGSYMEPTQAFLIIDCQVVSHKKICAISAHKHVSNYCPRFQHITHVLNERSVLNLHTCI